LQCALTFCVYVPGTYISLLLSGLILNVNV
jgi:hypothetical protein